MGGGGGLGVGEWGGGGDELCGNEVGGLGGGDELCGGEVGGLGVGEWRGGGGDLLNQTSNLLKSDIRFTKIMGTSYLLNQTSDLLNQI